MAVEPRVRNRTQNPFLQRIPQRTHLLLIARQLLPAIQAEPKNGQSCCFLTTNTFRLPHSIVRRLHAFIHGGKRSSVSGNGSSVNCNRSSMHGKRELRRRTDEI